MAQISLTKIETHNMPQPYSDCKPMELIDTKASRKMKEIDMNYNRKSCLYVCQQLITIDQVGCNNMQLPIILKDYPLCRNKTSYNSLSNVTFNREMCTDLCPIECDSVTFEMSVSYANYPTYDMYYKIFFYFGDFFSTLFGTTNVSYDLFRKSISGGFIFYKDIKYTELEETPSMTFVDLVAAIGGMMGLFLGFSIMILVELIELAFEFLFIVCKNHFMVRSNIINVQPKI